MSALIPARDGNEPVSVYSNRVSAAEIRISKNDGRRLARGNGRK